MSVYNYNKKVFLIKKYLFISFIALFFFLVLIISYGFIKKNNPLFFSQLFNTSLLNIKTTKSYISGILKDGTKYYFYADNLSKDINNLINQTNVPLLNPVINLEIKNKTSVVILAKEALLNNSLKTVNLNKDVFIKSSNDFKANLENLLYNINSGNLSSSGVVLAEYNNHNINALGVDVNKNIIKTGSVEIINPLKNIYIKSNSLILDDNNKILTLIGDSFFKNKNLSLKANRIVVKYLNLNSSKDNIENIRATDSVIIEILNNTANTALITGYQYIYSSKDDIMVITTNKEIKKSSVIYSSKNINIKAYDRLEYQPNKLTLIAWGEPSLTLRTFKNDIINETYTLSAKTLTAKLNDNKKDISTAEAFNSVVFLFKNETIRSDYALFNNLERTIVFLNNVSIKDDKKTIQGCKLIVKLDDNITELISCNDANNKIEVKR